MHVARAAFAAFLSIVAMSATAPGSFADPPGAEAPSATHLSLYRSLMELNGVMRNIREVVASSKQDLKALLLERAHKTAFSADQAKRFDALADAEYAGAQAGIIDSIALAQSGALTDDDLAQLIAANSTAAAAKYAALKFANSEAAANDVQTYMVDAVVAIVKAFQASAAQPAAGYDDGNALADAARLTLARQLLANDGTEALVRKVVGETHMKLIIEEVNNHIALASLSEDDKYRLASLAASAQATLSKRILDRSARAFAKGLGADELAGLSEAFSAPAQKKLTALRLADDGGLDAYADKRLNAAAENVAIAFESEFPPPP